MHCYLLNTILRITVLLILAPSQSQVMPTRAAGVPIYYLFSRSHLHRLVGFPRYTWPVPPSKCFTTYAVVKARCRHSYRRAYCPPNRSSRTKPIILASWPWGKTSITKTSVLGMLGSNHTVLRNPPRHMNHVPKTLSLPSAKESSTRGSKTPVISIHAFDFERVCHQLHQKGLSSVRLDDAGKVAESPLLSSPLKRGAAVVWRSAN